ncbi:MAG: HK97 family phage prohead protease [Candidatus Methanomethylicaceae archaeon]
MEKKRDSLLWEVKTVNLIPSTKETEFGEGEIIGYAATWDIDLVGDRFAPGAFVNLDEFVQSGFITLGHDWQSVPIAYPIEATQDAQGLLIRAKFHTHPEAQAAYTYVLERLQARKTVPLSIGFVVEKSHYEEDPDRQMQVRVITAARLYEVSLVNVPANNQARVFSVKTAEEAIRKNYDSDDITYRDVLEHLVYKFAEKVGEVAEAKADEEDWRVGGARDLELIDDASWDADAAEAQVRKLAGGDPASDDFDWSLYRKAFVVYNRAKPKLITSYKLPFAKVRKGELVASRRGLIAVRVVLRGGRGGVKLPEEVVKEAEDFVSHYLDRE